MYERMQGVALRTIRHNDKNAIVHVYTDTHGLLAFLLPQSTGKAARMKRALFQPLSLVELVADIVPSREIFHIRECRCLMPLPQIHTDPVRNAIAMFLTELLSHVIQEQERNMPLFSFITGSVQLLDKEKEGIANFHICFLYNLGILIGIEPDTSTYSRGSYFDMVNGIFSPTPPLHGRYLMPEEAEVLMKLSRMTYSNMHLFRFNRRDRSRLLDLMLSYYSLHNSSLGTLRSPEVLSELFAD